MFTPLGEQLMKAESAYRRERLVNRTRRWAALRRPRRGALERRWHLAIRTALPH